MAPLAQLEVRRVGLTDRLKFALWASGFSVEVLLDEPVFEDQPMTGRVRLRCGEQPVTVTRIELTYRGGSTAEDEQGRETDRFTTYDSFSAPLGGTLHPGQEIEVPFSRAFDHRHAFDGQCEWVELMAEVDVPGAQNPAARRPFTVSPSPPLDTLRRALIEQLGWGEPSLRYDLANQTRWLCMAFTAVPPAYTRTIDAVIVRAQPVDVAYGHSIVTAAAGPSSGGPLSFLTRAGAACAIALECVIDRDGKGIAGAFKEMMGKDKIGDRYIARDVESAVARVRAMIEHAAQLGPVR
jgi:sporulation-control protein spo0M